uniref:Uncharacterized protein n=1 Tax=Globodera rostochiensis TaxID=31243 RepID=A0A914H999_GLORO
MFTRSFDDDNDDDDVVSVLPKLGKKEEKRPQGNFNLNGPICLFSYPKVILPVEENSAVVSKQKHKAQ